MKKFVLVALLFGACVVAHAGEIVLEITYAGKNVFVSNPMRANGTFCAYTVLVNGEEIKPDATSSSFEIMLDEMEFKTGDAIKIVLTHYEDCKPVILSQH